MKMQGCGLALLVCVLRFAFLAPQRSLGTDAYLEPPTVHPPDGSMNVDRGSTFQLLFRNTSQLTLGNGGPTGIPMLEVRNMDTADVRHVLMNDTDLVKLRGPEMLLVNSPPLEASHNYRITLWEQALQGLRYNVSFTFRTRPEDLSPPVPLLFHPPNGSVMSMLEATDLEPSVLFSKALSPGRIVGLQLEANSSMELWVIPALVNCGSTEPLAPCIRLELDGRRIVFYPRGIDSKGSAIPWVVPGTKYKINLLEGAFTDATTTYARANPSEARSYSFEVLSDITGPYVVSTQWMSTDAGHVPDVVYLEFNEPILPRQPLYQADIRIQPVLGERPASLLSQELQIPGINQSIVLAFNAIVQAGSGLIAVRSVDDDREIIEPINISDAVFLGPKVVLDPNGGNNSVSPIGTKFYLQELTSGTVQTAPRPGVFRNGDIEINTKGTADFYMIRNGWRPTVVWTSLDEVACLPASGELPDVELMTSEEVEGWEWIPPAQNHTRTTTKPIAGNKDSSGTQDSSGTSDSNANNSGNNTNITTMTTRTATTTISRTTTTISTTTVTNATATYILHCFDDDAQDNGTNGSNGTTSINVTDLNNSNGTKRTRICKYVLVGGKEEAPHSQSAVPEIPLDALPLDVEDFVTNQEAQLVRCGPYGCGLMGEEVLWTLRPWPQEALGKLHIVISEKDRRRIVLRLSALDSNLAGSTGRPLTSGTYELRLSQGLVQSAKRGIFARLASTTLVFRICALRFDDPPSNLLRVYVTKPTIAYRDPQRYELKISSASLSDLAGNPTVGNYTSVYMPETTSPLLLDSQCIPARYFRYAMTRQNIVLTFNEDVQAGSGEIQLWDYDDANGLRFAFDVKTLGRTTPGGGKPIWGRQVLLSPGDLCTGKPPCGPLVAGTKYYVKTTARGVLLDAVGNPLNRLNTKLDRVDDPTGHLSNSEYDFSVADPRDEKAPAFWKRPEVAFAGAYSAPMDPTSMTAFIFFTEAVNWKSGFLSFTDCGKDGDCDTLHDNWKINDAHLTYKYSYGLKMGITGEFFFLRRFDDTSRRYQVTIPRSFVQDAAGKHELGPYNEYQFHMDTGLIARPSNDSLAPQIRTRRPANGSQVYAWDNLIVLNFNEDVTPGLGQLRICLNSDVNTSADSNCTEVPGMPVILAAPENIDGRIVRLRLPLWRAVGLRLFTTFEKDFVRDKSPSANPSDPIGFNDWFFDVLHDDTMGPRLDYVLAPLGVAGTLDLHFSEAVVLDAGAVGVLDELSQLVAPTSTEVWGRRVRITASWQAGAVYRVHVETRRVRDFEGLTMVSDTDGEEVANFRVSLDTKHPRLHWSQPALHGITGLQTTFVLVFNEVVQPAGGHVFVVEHKGGCGNGTWCEGGKEVLQASVHALPLFHSLRLDKLTSDAPPQLVNASTALIELPVQLEAGVAISLRIPRGAFVDVVGNPFEELATFAGSRVEVFEPGDHRLPAPAVVFVDFGSLPDFNFAGNSFNITFSEPVQQGSGTISLVPVDNCSSILDVNRIWKCGSSNFPILDLCFVNFSGATATISNLNVTEDLEPDTTYKLVLSRDAVRGTLGDVSNGYFDGECGANGTDLAAMLRRPPSEEAHQHRRHLDNQGPRLRGPNASMPWDGMVAVPPTTSIQLFFNEAVQAGFGNLNVSAQVLDVRSRSCFFEASVMTCATPGSLEPGRNQTIKLDQTAVLDLAGNLLMPLIDMDDNGGEPEQHKLEFSFQTLRIDNMGPEIISVDVLASAEAEHAAKTTVIALTFNKAVQAGVGSMELVDCSPGDPDACFDGDREPVSDSFLQIVDVQDAGIGREALLQYSGSRLFCTFPVYFNHSERNALRISTRGVFTDNEGRPLERLMNGANFSIVPDDLIDPILRMATPFSGTVSAPTAPIALVFSEPMQVAEGFPLRVSITDGHTSAQLVTDGSEPWNGNVRIVGPMVLLEPTIRFEYDATVNITIPHGIFKDLQGNLFAGVGPEVLNFRTSQWLIKQVHAQNGIAGFPPRNDTIFQEVFFGGRRVFMLYGGRAADGNCLSDLRISDTGAVWMEVNPFSHHFSHPAANGGLAGAASAVDASGCLWVLGGQCSGQGTNVVWKTCNGGLLWMQVPPIQNGPARPEVIQSKWLPAAPWPDSFAGHSMAIVGGWQLVIVDGPRGTVWQALDEKFALVVQVSSAAPFGPRWAPALFSSSDSKLYLVGGHLCNLTASSCPGTETLCDLWVSEDAGETWQSLTVDFCRKTGLGRPGLQEPLPLITLNDDVVFLERAHGRATGLTGAVAVEANLDSNASGIPLLTRPLDGATGVLADARLQLWFQESIQTSPNITLNAPRLRDAGTGLSHKLTWEVRRHLLTLSPVRRLPAGVTFSLEIPDGALLNEAGTPLRGFAESDGLTYLIDPDGEAPKVVDAYPTDITSVEPWTAIMLTMSEPVQAGNGNLEITCAHGANFSLPVNEFSIVEERVYIKPPQWLSGGQRYTLNIPAGLLQDVLGNILGIPSIHTFDVLSGFESSAIDRYSGTALRLFTRTFTEGPEGQDVKDEKPQLVSMYPPSGASDIEVNGFNLVVLFSEPVVMNENVTAEWGIQLMNSTTTVNVSDADVYYVRNGLMVRLMSYAPGVLAPGEEIQVHIPEGYAQDLAANPIPGVVGKFTCLAHEPAISPPVLLMTEPPRGFINVPRVNQTMRFWFSVDIVLQAGVLELVPQNGSSEIAGIFIPTRSDRISVEGNQLRVTVRGEDIALANTTYSMMLSHGAVEALERPGWGVPILNGSNSSQEALQFPGLSGTEFQFVTFAGAFDTARPVLLDTSPESEASPQFQLPPSTSIRLNFNEAVKASDVGGSVRFMPVSDLRPTVLAVSNSVEVIFSGSAVLLAPVSDLLAGAIYNIVIDPGAIVDLAGNPMANINRRLSFSTAPCIRLTPISPDLSDLAGRDVSKAVLADDGSHYLLGGPASVDRLVHGDIWKIDTGPGANCGAWRLPALAYGCSLYVCKGDPPTMGNEVLKIQVWQSPRGSGRPCVAQDSWTRSSKGEFVVVRDEPCRCPSCVSRPAEPLPQFMNVEATLSDWKPISSGGGELEVTCIPGYLPSRPFSCAAETRYAGYYVVYPSCFPAPCMFAAPIVPNQDVSQIERRCHEWTVSPYSSIPHGDKCTLTCLPNYYPSDKFTCSYGNWGPWDDDGDGVMDRFPPSCVRMTCPNTPPENGILYNVTPGLCDRDRILTGTVCKVQCLPGFRVVTASSGPYSGKRDVECTADGHSSSYTDMPQCKRQICEELDFGGTNIQMIPPIHQPPLVFGTKQRIDCMEGFQALPGSDLYMECMNITPWRESIVQWAGTLECVKTWCPSKPSALNGRYRCNGGEVSVYGDVCQLLCSHGYRVRNGNGYFVCREAFFEGSGECVENLCPPVDHSQVPHATGLDDPEATCTGWLRHGQTCKIHCQQPRVALGVFRCVYGEYGEMPNCINPSTAFRYEPWVKTVMMARVSYTPDAAEAHGFALPSDVHEDASLLNALTLGAMVGSNRTNPADVEILEVNGLAPPTSRRLAAGAEDPNASARSPLWSLQRRSLSRGDAIERAEAVKFDWPAPQRRQPLLAARQMQEADLPTTETSTVLLDTSTTTTTPPLQVDVVVMLKVRMEHDAQAEKLMADILRMNSWFSDRFQHTFNLHEDEIRLFDPRFEQPWRVYTWKTQETSFQPPAQTESSTGLHTALIIASVFAVGLVVALYIGYRFRERRKYKSDSFEVMTI